MSYDDDEMRNKAAMAQRQYDFHKAQLNAQQVQAQMNAAYGQQGIMGQNPYLSQSPFGVVTGEKKSIEDKKRAWEDAQMRADNLRSEYEKALFKEPVKGPSMEQMTKYPSLKSLWDELKAGMLLCGIKE